MPSSVDNDNSTKIVDKALDQGKEMVKDSFEDWLDYVSNHPGQTLAFGTILYFAAKGMLLSIIRRK